MALSTTMRLVSVLALATFGVVGVEAAPAMAEGRCDPVPGGIVLIGTAGNDILVGTPGDDTISGAGGNDTINAREYLTGAVTVAVGGQPQPVRRVPQQVLDVDGHVVEVEADAREVGPDVVVHRP
jgi:hypothetical protein